jgi:hypothetical protein
VPPVRDAGALRAGEAWLRHLKQVVDHEQFAEGDPVRLVDAKQVGGGASDGRAADEFAALVAEVIRPFMAAGVEQRRELAGQRVEAGDIRAFVDVAVIAGKGKVARDRAAAMLAGDDVIELEGDTAPGLRKAAIFAAAVGPLAYQPLQGGIHAGNP